MYRISFDVNSSRWTISLQRFGFLWVPIKEQTKVQSWPDYEAAAAYVEKVGLARVYVNWNDGTTAAIWQGVQMPHHQVTWQLQGEPTAIRRREA